MVNLLRANFRRFFKDRLFIVSLIVLAALGLFMAVIQYILKGIITDVSDPSFGLSITGFAMFGTSFSISSDFGFILPVFLIVIIVKEFSFGTIRNKVIAGYSKAKIFLSTWITAMVFGLLLVSIYAFYNLGLGSLFLGFGNASFGDVMKTFGLGLLIYAGFLSFTIFFAFLFRNIGLPIAIVLASSFVLSLLMIVDQVFVTDPDNNNMALRFFEAIRPFNAQYQNSLLVTNVWSTNDLLTTIGSSLVYIGLYLGLGLIIFPRTDLK